MPEDSSPTRLRYGVNRNTGTVHVYDPAEEANASLPEWAELVSVCHRRSGGVARITHDRTAYKVSRHVCGHCENALRGTDEWQTVLEMADAYFSERADKRGVSQFDYDEMDELEEELRQKVRP